jgi:hypothetical protein
MAKILPSPGRKQWPGTGEWIPVRAESRKNPLLTYENLS